MNKSSPKPSEIYLCLFGSTLRLLTILAFLQYESLCIKVCTVQGLVQKKIRKSKQRLIFFIWY